MDRGKRSHSERTESGSTKLDAEKLFVSTLDDLAARTSGEVTEYSLLRAAGLLRQLLLDGNPLVHQAARRHPDVPIRFQVRVDKLDHAHEMQYWLGLDPETAPPERGATRDVDLQGLLAVPVILLDRGRTILLLKHVITWAAHVSGGIHRGRPREREIEHRAFEAFPVKLGLHREAAPAEQDIPMELEYIRVIAPVVLRGLEPLRRAIEAGWARTEGPPS